MNNNNSSTSSSQSTPLLQKQDHDNFLSVLKMASGMYVDLKSSNRTKTNVNEAEINQTVIVTGCNYGYMNHLHNFKCFIDRLGLKVLVFAMDRKTHEYVQKHMSSDGNMYSYLMGDENEDGGPKGVVAEASTEFRSQQFHIITVRKKQSVLRVLEAGYNAIFIDPDVVMQRDPINYLFWENVDYVHSLNWICPQ